MTMYKLGLTGSIATGKSTALAMFAHLGHRTFSADTAVHKLYEEKAVDLVGAAFPEAIRNKKVDRRALSDSLLAAPHRLKELNDIVHPLVYSRIDGFMEQARRTGARLVVVDIPLLFESEREHDFDGVAVTWCSARLQKRRALARPGMSVEKFNTILALQLSQREKKSRADFLIETNGTLEQTRQQVVRIASLCLNPPPGESAGS
ncbi:MAG TPA: dephospho-CoA kinase [Devosia sp.]|nr:dephospho-CoA kinase [Devosia sp.]